MKKANKCRYFHQKINEIKKRRQSNLISKVLGGRDYFW